MTLMGMSQVVTTLSSQVLRYLQQIKLCHFKAAMTALTDEDDVFYVIASGGLYSSIYIIIYST